MTAFVQGWGLTVVMLAVIAIVFVASLFHLHGELSWVRALTDHLGWALVADDAGTAKPAASLVAEAIRDEARAVQASSDPAWAQKQVRTWQMRAQRLESALAFWIDLLRQLGLLGTVLGLGLSLSIGGTDVAKLLDPLALAVWTTVAGLAFSIWLSAIFGIKLAAWGDACEKNIEAWDARRQAGAARA
jgi:hypothetical protein